SVILLIIGGCNSTSSTSLQAISNIETSSNNCPDKPSGALENQNVKTIDISSQTVTETGQVKAGQYLGYAFTAKSGDKLNYQTNDNICVWVYSPDNQIIPTTDLTQDGKYIVQVSVPRGATTFALNMGLENNDNANSIVSDSPTSVTPAASQTTISNTGDNSRTSPTTTIERYYQHLNSSNYRNAWNTLSDSLRSNRQEHPQGYSSYLEWWEQVKYIDTQKLGTKTNNDSAYVTVKCGYNLASGRKIYATVRYYLEWNSSISDWEIMRVTKIS
ncbi:MAG: hypothetical protein EAZ76_15045, partial [Nostocales cyanobacterium]